MRSFSEWCVDTLKGINRAEISEAERTTLLAELDAVKQNRKIEQLNRVMKKLHILGLKELCPTAQEIEEWAEKEEIRL